MTSSASGSSDTKMGYISIDLVNDLPFAWYDRSRGWCIPPCRMDEMGRSRDDVCYRGEGHFVSDQRSMIIEAKDEEVEYRRLGGSNSLVRRPSFGVCGGYSCPADSGGL